MKVRDVMTSEVVWVSPDTKVDAIARLMVDDDISGVPVVDASGKVIGIVTETDMVARNAELHFPVFLQFMDARFYVRSPRHYDEEVRRVLAIVAREIMSSPAVVVSPDDPLEHAASLMFNKANPLPVVENGKLVGIISRSDIIRLMAAEAEEAEPKESDRPQDEA